MIEHWYEYLPAAWFVGEGRWIVSASLVVIFLLGLALGYWLGKRERYTSHHRR